MKLFSIALMALIASSAFAQSRGDRTRIQINGRGGFVCSAKAMASDGPVLARGESKREAEVLAIQECQAQGGSIFCSVQDCEKDSVNGHSVDVIFDIRREGSRVAVNYSGNVKYLCTADAFGKIYAAKAPTKVEAKVLAANVCADDRDGNAFFCDVSDIDCEQVSGTSVRGRRGIGGRILDIFNR